MSCCCLYLIIGSILLHTFSYAQPNHGFWNMKPNWTLSDVFFDQGPTLWGEGKNVCAKPSFFRVEPLADCDRAIAAIPDGTLQFDPANPGTRAKWNANVPSSAWERRFALPAAIRHRSCLVLIDGDRAGGIPLYPSVTGLDWYLHLYTRVFPIARKLAERMRQNTNLLLPPRILGSVFTIKSGIEEGRGHGFQYGIRITGILKGYRGPMGQYKTIFGAGKAGNHAVRRMGFPAEGWQIILTAPLPDLEPLEQWRGVSRRFNLYEAEGTYSGIGKRGLWWVLDAYNLQ